MHDFFLSLQRMADVSIVLANILPSPPFGHRTCPRTSNISLPRSSSVGSEAHRAAFGRA